MIKIDDKIIRVLSEKYDLEEFKHAYRFNGVLDIYKFGFNIYVIVENKHYKVYKENMIDFAISKLSEYPKRDTFKKVKLGISYKEFKHDKNKNLVYESKKSEDYHWVNNINEKSEDDLYFLIGENNVKIGRSSDVRARVRTLSTGIPFDFIVYVFRGKGFMESKMHECFSELHKNREWFNYDVRFDTFISRYFSYENGYLIRSESLLFHSADKNKNILDNI